jgi:hypothetical protein
MNIVNDVAMTTLAATAAILALHSMPCSASKSGTTWRHTTQNVVPGNQTEAWLLRPAHTPASTFTSSTDIHPPNKVKLALLRLPWLRLACHVSIAIGLACCCSILLMLLCIIIFVATIHLQ